MLSRSGNALRNFNYLIACPETGDALAIDPLDFEKCLSRAKDRGWDITQILNTHEHGDHTGGNGPVIEATGAKLLAHKNAGRRIDGIDVGLSAGDVVTVGKTVELLALDTPGHTMSHICLLSKTDAPALFCGDTLFNAGAGNCHGGGHPEELYETFSAQLDELPEQTLELLALDTPGHTMSHICLLSKTDAPALFCGDTLFNAGAVYRRTAGTDPRVSGTRLHHEQPRVHAGPGARQRRGGEAVAPTRKDP